MRANPGRFSLGTGLSPTVYGRHMNESSHIRASRLFSRRALLLLLVPLVAAPQVLQGQDGQAYEVLEAANERHYDLETLCAHFDQVIEVTLLKRTVPSEGTVCWRLPDRFSMRWSDPEGDLVVVDGEFLWTFHPSMDDKQVMRFSAEGAGGGFNFYKNFLDNPRGRFTAVYEGRESMGEGTSHKIALTPKGPSGVRSAGFRTAIVWLDVDSLLITAVQYQDTNETIRSLKLSDIRVDIEIPDEVFRFVPPEGSRVTIDPRARG